MSGMIWKAFMRMQTGLVIKVYSLHQGRMGKIRRLPLFKPTEDHEAE